MRFSLILTLLALSALPSRADDAAPLPKEQPQDAQPAPAPQLMHLERSLMQKQDARDKGELPPEKYQQFVVSFRVELDAVMARVPSNPENKGLHAQILARLGEQERGQALTSLEQALAEDPENSALLVAKGSILHEQKDYPAAAELARQAWEASGRKDQRAWALLKMSEGRISGARSGEPASQLRPASDFAKLDWSIPENHDINPQALGLIRQATVARRRFDMAGTWRYAQAAMNADPTSHSVQKLYGLYKADQEKHADMKAYVERAAVSIEAGRGAEGVAWAQRAYDRSPSDDTYGILQDVRRRSAELEVKRAAEPPAKAPAPKRSSPLLPIMLITGAGLMAAGGYKIVKSKDARTSDDGINPAPYVSPEQARRNYVNSAVLIGAPVVIFGLVYGGPIAWNAVAPVAATALRGGRESIQRVALSEAGAINPGTTGTVWDSIKATGPLIKGTDIPRSFDILVNGRLLVVHPVATKHFAQHLGRFGGGYVSPATSQAFMASFRSALEKATARGLPKFGEKIVVDGWEFVLSQWPSQANPVVQHAVYLGR
ncbi:MAG: hypothetical protein M0D55_06780 [Elusimicrobiota bacterium]|nr:MAG: hypothetical protein M0D55_06780 [Elusimicrobiota bacterium]